MRRAVDIPDGLGVDELMRIAIGATHSTYPHPNPRVGALILTPDHSVLSLGVHRGPGQPHAETNALAAVSDSDTLVGATALVTLEPCSHHGRTPPCAETLIEAGIAKVYVGAIDPDPRVSGLGIARLEAAGVEVVVGIASEDVVAADPGYFHHRRTGLPLVTLKVASTLDGQVAARDGSSQWITGEEAREDAHRLRSRHDAIAVGAGTVRADNPHLTIRLDGYEGPQPLPVIVKGSEPLPPEAAILEREHLIYGGNGSEADISSMLKDLGTRGIVSLMVEGGPSLASSFLREGAVDRIVWYLAGSIAGGVGRSAVSGVFETIADAKQVEVTDVSMFGGDVRITAIPVGGH